ncbi:MAG TPA: efflux RND transporter periplasmic adaptor subunit [Tepidisphaeraceae bacterium]|nr:efflux RND transporter periplasmic adaptor subunit [Tepidisphaeraceae bacterium]
MRYSLFLKWMMAAMPMVLLASCNRQQAGAPPSFPPEVSVAQASTQNVPIYLNEIGKTSAAETVSVQPQVTGKLVGIHFKDGAFVKKGDLLYSIDPRPFQADLAAKQAQLLQDQAQYQFAKAEFARVQKLKGTQAISQEDYDTKKNAMEVAAAQIKAAQAAIETAQLNLEYCQIKSPIDGRTGQHLVDVGNVVNAGGPNGGTNMLVINRIDPIYADFTVTENDLDTVKRYMQLAHESQKHLQVLVDTPNAVNIVEEALSSGKPVPTTQTTGQRAGSLEFLNNAVQDGTGTVKLRAAIPNADHHFWPGQYVSVRLILTTDENAILVPSEAIQISQDGQFVFVVTPEGTVKQQPVVVGQKQGDMVVLNSGIHAGEQVVTTGQLLLMPGMKVSVVGGKTPTTRTAQDSSESSRSDGGRS